MSAATEAPAEPVTPGLAQAAPTIAPTFSAEDAYRGIGTATPESALKSLAPEEPAPAPVPLALEIGLLVVAVVSGILAWLLRAAFERTWREKTK
jgi:hypothetical protein